MKRIFRQIEYGIKNLITWFPVIWNDRQWDHIFLLEILKKKLSLMEDYFRTNAHHVGADKDADNIKLTINLIDRLLEDKYFENAFVPHKKKYGNPEFICKDIPDREGHKEVLIKYENEPQTEEEKKKERGLFQRCVNREDYLKKQDLDLLFDHLKKHILEWWD